MRREAAERLARAGEDGAAAAAALLEALDDEDSEVRDWTVAALEGLGKPPYDEAGRIAQMLSHPRLDVVYWAATLLGRLGTQASDWSAQVAVLLDDHPDVVVRRRAAWALARIGSTSKEVVDALRRAAKEPEPALVRAATDALRTLEG